jgi:putative transposase
MPYDPDQHHRSSIRLARYDYSRHGAYFVTICADRKACLFGEVQQQVLLPSPWGKIVEDCWRAIPQHFQEIELDAYVVMPNHIHGILWFLNDEPETAKKRPSLGTVPGSFKSAVTRAINESTGMRGALVWQRNYFEHIIRDDDSLSSIREYIQENPARWAHDAENELGDGTDDLQRWLDRLIIPSRGEAPPRPSLKTQTVQPNQGGRGMPRPYNAEKPQ